MGRYVRKMQLMLTSMANFSVQTNIVDLDQTALRKPYISYDFSDGGGEGAVEPLPPPPPCLDHRIMNRPN